MWLLWACGGAEQPPLEIPPAEPSPAAPGLPPLVLPKANEAQPPADTKVARVAVVREVLKTDRYTFARMDACGMEAWVAGPVMDLEVGKAVAMPAGTPVSNFESVSLGRTFEAILFVDWIADSEAEPACAPPVMPTDKQRIGVVRETFVAGGYTYARLDHCGSEWWFAASSPEPPLGVTVLTDRGNEMVNFNSPSLGRTFPSIVFVNGVTPVTGVPLCDP